MQSLRAVLLRRNM